MTAAQNEAPKRGVKTRLFGVVMMFLGALDAMLFWRAGAAVNDYFLFLMAMGLLLYFIGTIRRGSGA